MDEVDGLEESFRITFYDVAFCLKPLDKGYYNLYTPFVELYPHKTVSVDIPKNITRGTKESQREVEIIYERWAKLLLQNPYYNRNLNLREGDFSVRIMKQTNQQVQK